MPIHDWTRVSAGTWHNFHQDWTIEICRTLNSSVLPPGYFAMADQRVSGPEPDVIALRTGPPPSPGGIVVADAPPQTKQVGRFRRDRAIYARKANRLSIRDDLGNVVAIIEVVSPGNKDRNDDFSAFVGKVVEFLKGGIHVVVVDLFPPTLRDPEGIHLAIWQKWTGEPFEPRPADKPLTVASYEVGDDETAYVDPVAVGDPLPDAPLFLAPGWYVKIPLERTYTTSWNLTPQPIRDRVEPPRA